MDESGLSLLTRKSHVARNKGVTNVSETYLSPRQKSIANLKVRLTNDNRYGAVCLGDVLAFQKENNRSLLNASQESQETKGVKNV